MAREAEAYRDNLEALIACYGNRRLLTAKDVADFCGRDVRTVSKKYGIDKSGITMATLARRMAR
ncbi:MAG: hypothetical protein VB039_05280 [Oscillospiraceae bacterium]|nr:hypothetical protein [Oscillospiraceae bacterium]